MKYLLHVLVLAWLPFYGFAQESGGRSASCGAVSTGGGNIDLADQVPLANYSWLIVNDSPSAIYVWFQKHLNAYQEDSDSYLRNNPQFVKMFVDPVKTLKILKNLTVEIKSTEPCYDFAGNAVDGSINTTTENAICISTHRISKKLDGYSYERETLALMIHEISHLFDTSEIEADEIQGDARFSFASTSTLDLAVELDMQVKYFRELQQSITSLILVGEKGDAYYLSSIRNTMLNSREELFTFQYSFLDFDAYKIYTPQFMRLSVAESFYGYKNNPELSEYHKEVLDTQFQGQDQATAWQIIYNENGFDSHESGYHDVVIEYPHSFENVKSELLKLSKYYEKVELQMKQLKERRFKVIHQ